MTELSRSKKRDYNSITSNDFAVQAATLESELSSLQQVVSAGGNDELLAAINDAIASDEYDAVYEKWFGSAPTE